MKSFNLNVPDDKAQEFAKEMVALMQKHGVTVKNKKELIALFPITERVNTFDDAVRELGEDHPHVKAYRACSETLDSPEHDRDLLAYLKIRIVVTALNEGWEPKFTEGEYRYAPWFDLYTQEEIDKLDDEDRGRAVDRCNNNANAGGGLVCSSAYSASAFSSASVGGRLCFKSHELAKYAGEAFLELWADLMLF